MSELTMFSIVITNFNYARFVKEAIDSALNLDWPSIEVIVVDDGSTDNSRQILDSYGDRIACIYQENQGQRVATNVGFAASRGDAIVFLDADDILKPDLANEVAAVWHTRVSKVQVLMEKVDQHGRSINSIMPRLRTPPSSGQIRQWAEGLGEYPSPPGSGNIYARSYLEKIMPLHADRDYAPDSTCIAMAPFFGDVVTVVRPLVLYRLHGANDSNLLSSEKNFAREVSRAIKRLEAAQDACRAIGIPCPSQYALRRGGHLLQLRAASMRLLPREHPLPGDNRIKAILDACTLLFRDNFESLNRRFAMAAYALLVLVLPLPIARYLIRIRFRVG